MLRGWVVIDGQICGIPDGFRLSTRDTFPSPACQPTAACSEARQGGRGDATQRRDGLGHVEPKGAMPRSPGPGWTVTGWRCEVCHDWISEGQIGEPCLPIRQRPQDEPGAVPGDSAC